MQMRVVRDRLKMGAWDEDLFKRFKIVAVDPWCGSSLTLLDAFTKEYSFIKRYSFPNRGALLASRGAMTGLVKKSSDGNPEGSFAQAQTNLEEARMGRGRHCQSDEHPPLYSTLNSSSKILASLESIVCIDHSKSKELYVEASMVNSVRIKQDFLTEQVQGRRWKPDPSSPLVPKNW